PRAACRRRGRRRGRRVRTSFPTTATAPASAAPEVGIEDVAAADDDVADLADHQLMLAALVVRRLPAEEIHVEGAALLVVRRAERQVIEPHGFPPCRVEWGGRSAGDGGARRLARFRVAVAVADLQREAVGILHVKAFVALAVV